MAQILCRHRICQGIGQDEQNSENCNDKKAKLDSVYKPDGTLTETPDETLEIMEKSHFKDGDPPTHTNTNTSPDKHLSQIIYSESRMQEAISSFDPLKAAGPDTLQPLTIQKAWHHIHKTVRNIMINCMQDTFARATHSAKRARDDRVSCIQNDQKP